MITVGELRKRLGIYPSEALVFMVTMRRDVRADIIDGGTPVRSSIQPWLVFDKGHVPAGRVTLWEHVALEEESTEAHLMTGASVLQRLVEAIGRHPAAEDDPEIADAINAIEKELAGEPNGRLYTDELPDFTNTLEGVAGMMWELNEHQKTNPLPFLANYRWSWKWVPEESAYLCKKADGGGSWEYPLCYSPKDRPGDCVGDAYMSVFGKEADDGD